MGVPSVYAAARVEVDLDILDGPEGAAVEPTTAVCCCPGPCNPVILQAVTCSRSQRPSCSAPAPLISPIQPAVYVPTTYAAMAAITARPSTMETASLHTPGRGGLQQQQQQQRSQPQPQSQTSPSSSVPASPTLSNPDMILPDDPYYGHGNSPDSEIDARIRSKFMMWKSAQAAVTATSDLHKMFAVNSAQMGYDQQNGYGSSAPLTPTTPIIYGNGTILSDIGEVTEVESTAGHPSPPRYRGPATHRRNASIDAVLRATSPVTGQSGLAKKLKPSLTTQKERRMSTESTSTITTITMEDRPAFLADINIDDAASVDDSVFQGDDEESMASSYVEGTVPRDRNRLGVAESENGDRLSTHSTTALSRRAEAILANAKKRLTVRHCMQCRRPIYRMTKLTL